MPTNANPTGKGGAGGAAADIENTSVPSAAPRSNPLDSCVSMFKHGKATDVECNVPLRNVLGQIRNGTYATAILKLRELLGRGDKAAYDRGKVKLPGFTPAGTFTRRLDSDLIDHSDLVVLDFDKVENLCALRERVQIDKHVVFVFLSPSGHGLKVGVHVSHCTDKAAHRDAWSMAAKHAETAWDAKADPSGKNVSRLCFVSDDAQVFVNEEALVLTGTQSVGGAAGAGTQSRQTPLEHKVGNDAGTQSRQQSTGTQTTHSISTASSRKIEHELSPEERAEVEAAIRATLPEVVGQRNNRIFRLACRLKAIGALADRPGHHLREFVQAWHDRALPVIGTQEFETTWVDFLNAWPNAMPHGQRFREIVRSSIESPDPLARQVVSLFGVAKPEFHALVALCCALDLYHKGGQWPLACRIASDAVDVNFKTAAVWLQLLVRNGVLVLMAPSRVEGRRAAEYRLNRDWGLEP